MAYRDRAEECRVIARTLHGLETRRNLLRVAEEYDRMAIQAAAKELQEAELESEAKAIGAPTAEKLE